MVLLTLIAPRDVSGDRKSSPATISLLWRPDHTSSSPATRPYVVFSGDHTSSPHRPNCRGTFRSTHGGVPFRLTVSICRPLRSRRDESEWHVLGFQRRQEQPINFAGDSDRRSKSGPDLEILNAAATGSESMAQIMANEYNQEIVMTIS